MIKPAERINATIRSRESYPGEMAVCLAGARMPGRHTMEAHGPGTNNPGRMGRTMTIRGGPGLMIELRHSHFATTLWLYENKRRGYTPRVLASSRLLEYYAAPLPCSTFSRGDERVVELHAEITVEAAGAKRRRICAQIVPCIL